MDYYTVFKNGTAKYYFKAEDIIEAKELGRRLIGYSGRMEVMAGVYKGATAKKIPAIWRS